MDEKLIIKALLNNPAEVARLWRAVLQSPDGKDTR